MERATKEIRQVSQREEPQRKSSVQEDPSTLRPPTLTKDGTSVSTGTQKYHLKKQNKQQKIERWLSQKQRSYWMTHHGTSGADYEVPIPTAGHRGQMYPAGLALQHPAANLLMEYATVGCPRKVGKSWTMEDLEEA